MIEYRFVAMVPLPGLRLLLRVKHTPINRELGNAVGNAALRYIVYKLPFLTPPAQGDWGEFDAHDRQSNDRAVQDGTRILSAYQLSDGTRLWIITEADRSTTTLLLPEEY
jgi:hypothetical protein